MAVLQISISVRLLDLKITVVAIQLIAGGDVDVITVECDAAQATICPATFKVYAARVPVDMLLARLRIEIDRVYAAVAFALLAATHD